jgi:hypothetical protein
MPGADRLRGSRERDKLTITEVCPDLGIDRWTFYEWRAKGREQRAHQVSERQPPRPPVRISAVAARPLPRQTMTTDTRHPTGISFYSKAGRFFAEQKAIILPEKFWA